MLLAGDAAHVHLPAGGPGLSTGLCDASNLGWKLARVVRGADERLLDTYHAERHLAGARVITHTRAQSALMTASANTAALRAVLAEVFAEPGALRIITDMLQGTDTRYEPSDANTADAVGRFTRTLTAKTEAGDRPLSALLRLPCGLLLDATGDLLRYADHPGIDIIPVKEGPSKLVRPDGFVAWEGDRAQLATAIRRWFA